MKREDLFKKYYKSKYHDYEITDTLSAAPGINIAFVYSGRERGKSYEIASQCIADAWYDNKQLGYVRRHDATIYDVELYFNDKHDFIRDMTDGQYCGITRKNGRLVFYSEVEADGIMKKVPGKECGFFFALSRQGSYKSEQFPEVYNLIYEEVLTDENYLRAEPEKIMNLYSTVLRGKPRSECRMWLISNLVSAVNPYSKAWGIMLAQNKPGDVRISKLYLGSYNEAGEEDYYLIAAHYLVNKNDLDKKDLKKNRLRVKTGVASNKWDELQLYTTIDLSFIRQFKPEATAVFELDDMMIQCNVLQVPDNIYDVYIQDEDDETLEPIEFSSTTMPILYFRRKTTPIKPGTRIYTNNAERFSPYVSRGFKVLCILDNIIRNLYDRGWMVGADNLTMNDFRQIYRKLSMVAI